MRRKFMSGLMALVLVFSMATPAFAAPGDTGDAGDTGDTGDGGGTADAGLHVTVGVDKSSLAAAAGSVTCTISVENTSDTTVNNGSVVVSLDGPGTVANDGGSDRWTNQKFEAGASIESIMTISLPENTTDEAVTTTVNITVTGDELTAPVSGSGVLTHQAAAAGGNGTGNGNNDGDDDGDKDDGDGNGNGANTPANPDGNVGTASLTVRQYLNQEPEARNNITVHAGDKIYWEFTYTNTGKVALSGSYITAVFPASSGITYRANSVAAGTAPQFNANQCTWSVPDLDVGEHVQLSVIGEIADSASAATFTSADKDFLFTGYGYYVDKDGKQAQMNVAYDSGFTMVVDASSATVTITPAVRVNDAEAASAAASVKVQAGDKLTYEITVKNTGKVDAKKINVKAQIPNTFVLDEKSIDNDGQIAKGDVNTVIAWELEELKAGETKVLKFSGTVPAEVGKDGVELKSVMIADWENKEADSKDVTATTSVMVSQKQAAAPKVEVTALGVTTGNQNLPQASSTEIKATVRYDGLTVGEEYGLTCTLYDVDTGKPLTVSNGSIGGWVHTDEVIKIDGINGMSYTGGWSYQGGSTATVAAQTRTFKAEAVYGGIDVKFSVDSSKLAGKRVAVVAAISQGTTVIGTSTQPVVGTLSTAAVTVPSVSAALAGPDKTQNVAVKTGASVVATVNCGAMVPGNTYRVVATLTDGNGNAITMNGAAVTATDEFTASGASMARTITLNLDTSKMSGKSLRVNTVLYNVSGTSTTQLASASSTTAVTVKTVATVQTGVDNSLMPFMIALSVSCFGVAACLGMWLYRRREDGFQQ